MWLDLFFFSFSLQFSLSLFLYLWRNAHFFRFGAVTKSNVESLSLSACHNFFSSEHIQVEFLLRRETIHNSLREPFWGTLSLRRNISMGDL